MNRILTIIVLSSLLAISVSAQDTSKVKTRNHELTVGITPLVQNLLRVGSIYNSGFEPELGFMYKYHFNKFAIRAGFNGNYDISETSAEIDKQDSESLDKGFGVNLGLELDNMIYKKWYVFYGIDLRYRYNRMKSKTIYNDPASYTEKTVYESKQRDKGAEAFLGIRFHFNNRFSLSTQMSMQFWLQNTISSRISYPDYGSNYKTKGSGTDFSILYPLFVDFSVRF